MQSKVIKSTLTKAVSLFLKNEVEKSFALIDCIDLAKVSPKDRGGIHKVVMLQLIGTFYGASTLRELLAQLNVSSNNVAKIWRKVSHPQVKEMFNHVSRAVFKEAFLDISSKSASTQSRAEITMVGDDTIVRTWLVDEKKNDFFAKFFSGQTHSTVYGFRVNLLGVVLNGTFYPLQFDLVRKSEKSSTIMNESVKKVCDWIKGITASAGLETPQLYASVDGGFTDMELLETFESNNVTPIMVPKNNNVVTHNGKSLNINDLKEREFKRQEALFYENEKNKGLPFTLRLRVHLKAINREVTLLLFRLNRSEKISAIFTTDKNIKSKTMRRHFFQRTQIEQFFRMIKHTLKLSQSKWENKEGFIKTISIFFLKATFCFRFRNFCRKKFRKLKKWSFYRLQQAVIHQNVDRAFLTDFIEK